MLHNPTVLRNLLAQIADRLHNKYTSLNDQFDWVAEMQWSILRACFIVRLLNEHQMLPEELAKRDVTLRSYRRRAKEERPLEFHLAHDLNHGRDWKCWFITLVQKIIHNEYFAPVTSHRDLESILFYSPRRPPRDEVEEFLRFGETEYLYRLDLGTLVALLKEAAACRDGGMDSFYLTADDL